MRLVVIDLIPALLSWEGRDQASEPDTPLGAAGVLEHLFSHYRLAAIADIGRTGATLRRMLEAAGLGSFFESVATTADFGPSLSARVIRRLASTVGVRIEAIAVVTARRELAESLGGARIGVVLLERPEDLDGVPAAIFDLSHGWAKP